MFVRHHEDIETPTQFATAAGEHTLNLHHRVFALSNKLTFAGIVSSLWGGVACAMGNMQALAAYYPASCLRFVCNSNAKGYEKAADGFRDILHVR
ncbi:unnamed protein product [Schistocephalus solidus]|uniref:Mitochondrial pyruvate carrier n=1 Tax=Schistocephalus solidus TaxID=70667 RepID=A0A183SRE5_SCHSO|nr:unnamed protein product [Schistocephalus solidus]